MISVVGWLTLSSKNGLYCDDKLVRIPERVFVPTDKQPDHIYITAFQRTKTKVKTGIFYMIHSFTVTQLKFPPIFPWRYIPNLGLPFQENHPGDF